MNNENENLEQEKKYDDDDEIVTIKYFDRINHQRIDLEVTKKIKRFMQADNKDRKRKLNRYKYYTRPFDAIFDEENHPENMKYLIDEKQDPYYILVEKKNQLIKEAQIEEQRTLIQNSLDILTPGQREVVEMAMYENMSYKDISNKLGISKSSVQTRMKLAQKNIKKHFKDTKN